MVTGTSMFVDTGQVGPKEPNSQMIEWRRSDGSSSRRPENVSFVDNRDSNGNVNWYRTIRDTEAVSVSWRREIGTYIAETLGLPSGKVYWMKGWPSGYGFYDHAKGTLPNPRHDVYLCGSATTVRFRSKNEFKPHAKWLMTDSTLDTRNCRCKYCTKTKSQVEVNQMQGLGGLQRPPESHLRGTRPTPGESLTHARRRVIREAMKEQKAKALKPTDQPLTALPERLRDLNSGRNFRPFELVWVALRDPIYITEDHSVVIDFWPATIVSYTTKNEPTPHKPGDTNYDIIARSIFTINLLGVNHQVLVHEERLLPQLGYVPTQGLLDAVKDCEPTRPLDREFTEYARFNPLPEFDRVIPIPAGSYTREDALPAFCLALHIVACLTPVWCATHSYSSDDKKAQVDDLFQGLWWGSERIWLDDVVRLRPSRDELDPENALGLLPSSSSDSALRALLLRLTYIMVDREDPTGMSVCVGGDLYELAKKETQPQSPERQPTRQTIFGPPTGLLGPAPGQPIASGSGSGSGINATIGPSLAESPVSMPEAPPGFVFRKLLNPGSEIIVDVGAIAGRYYPKIIQADTLDRVMRTLNQESGVRAGETVSGTIDGYARERIRRARGGQEAFETASDELTQLLALSGLFLGEGNAMQPEQWAKGRMQTIKGAETNGKKVLYEQWSKLTESSDVEMVDA